MVADAAKAVQLTGVAAVVAKVQEPARTLQMKTLVRRPPDYQGKSMLLLSVLHADMAMLMMMSPTSLQSIQLR